MIEPINIELPEVFLRNVKSVWRNEAEDWLNQLPNLLGLLSKKWALTDLKPISNMTYNFVAKALQGEIPVIIKVSCDKFVYEDECAALRNFDGTGSVKLLDSDSDYQAI